MGSHCHCWLCRKRVFFLPSAYSLLIFALESFAATGWRVGWLIGPPSIINPTLAASTRIVFCTNSPLQEAAAAGLEQAAANRFFETQLREYQERRDLFVSAFDRLGISYSLPEGTYFVLMVRPKRFGRGYPFSYFPRRTHPALNFPMITPFRKVCWEGVAIFGDIFSAHVWPDGILCR